MKHKTLYLLLSGLMVLSMLLASCVQDEPTPEAVVTDEVVVTEVPVEPEEPVVTDVPVVTEEPEVVFEPLSLSAPDCEYGGLFQSMEAVDQFTAFAIQPREHLEATGGGGPELLEHPIGTGPYMIGEWKRGDELVLTRFEDYWGEAALTPTVVFRWSSEAAQRLLELQAGTVDGIDNPGPDDFAVIAADPNLQLINRPALNIFYVGMNNTYAPFDNELVRQAIAMGIDRQRLVDNFFPVGSEVASHFTPCAIPNGCVGEPWYDFNPEAARDLLAQAGYPEGFTTEIAYRDVVRGYLPQPGVVAQDIQAQLLENLNITAEIVVMESGAYLDAADSGLLQGLHLLGWGADYPDMTNFLDYHFGGGSSAQFGEQWTDITDALRSGAALALDADRMPFYETANNAIRTHVPMVPISHGGSGVAFKATVEGGHASPLGNEYFGVMAVPGQDTFVWMQNAEPISLYCADETDGESLRACEQVTEALYSYEIGGTAAIPNLATECVSNEELTVWTCTLNQGVLFHDGSELDANDVVMSLMIQWDASNPLHIGNTGAFTYFTSLWGGFLNAPSE
ncbi:MAG: ABC transporter substrate-binding protein [Anaerolineales bacterium]|nr:ABC transporter substrate-binding protein [Anaerolineales bacterium]